MKKLLAAVALLVSCQPAYADMVGVTKSGALCQDEGGTAAACSTLNFTGAGVSTSTSNGTTTITIGAGSPYTAIANMTDNVNPAVCGTIYAVNVTAKTLTLPSAPATQVACHVGIYVAISGYATIAPGAGDTYAGNEKITQGMDVTGILDLWYVQGATTWYSQAGPPLQIWNANGSYAAGQFVVDAGAPSKFCMSRVADNTNNALTDTTKWLCVGDQSIPYTYLADGTDGQIITWDANGDIAVVGPGTSGQVLTSNGAGAAPTFQTASSSFNWPGSYKRVGGFNYINLASCSSAQFGAVGTSGAGTSAANVTDDVGYFCRYTTADTAGADAYQIGSAVNTEEGLAPIFRTRVEAVTTTGEVFVGLSSIATPDGRCATTDHCIGFEYISGTDTNWMCVTNDGATSTTRTSSGVTFAAGAFNVEIDWTAAATPVFKLNGTQVCNAHTSDLPGDTQDLRFNIQIKDTTTSSGAGETIGVAGIYLETY